LGAAHLEPLQTPAVELDEQAADGRLVGDRPGDDGLAAAAPLPCRPSNQVDQPVSQDTL
jgi:hypothetical protein